MLQSAQLLNFVEIFLLQYYSKAIWAQAAMLAKFKKVHIVSKSIWQIGRPFHDKAGYIFLRQLLCPFATIYSSALTILYNYNTANLSQLYKYQNGRN